MAKLSSTRASWPVLEGLPAPHRGKVRDTYDLGDGLLLVVATDAVSIFDFVLNALIPDKGIILTAMSVFQFKFLERHGYKTQLVAYGKNIDPYVPESLRDNNALQARAMVVKKLKMIDVEFIARRLFFASSSSFAEYRVETGGEICGITLPPGLQDGDELPQVIATPTTKEDNDHDQAKDAAQTRAEHPEATQILLETFALVAVQCREGGILLGDTKLEMGRDSEGNIAIGDEAYTPDSSRFLLRSEWVKSQQKTADRKAPAAFDKQRVRGWGIKQGVNKRKPGVPEDVEWVHALEVPASLIRATTQIYRYIFWRLTGKTIEQFLREDMGVRVAMTKKRVTVLLGSESDLPGINHVLEAFGPGGEAAFESFPVHVISCHRNPLELQGFAKTLSRDTSAIVAAGGMAFALPGVLDAWLRAFGKDVPVIGVALGEERSMALQAAQLSISQLPDQPVIMDELSGRVYTGPEGLAHALRRVAWGELPPPQERAEKLARMNVAII